MSWNLQWLHHYLHLCAVAQERDLDSKRYQILLHHREGIAFAVLCKTQIHHPVNDIWHLVHMSGMVADNHNRE